MTDGQTDEQTFANVELFLRQKNWSIGFLPYMVFPVPFEHFRAYVDIPGGSYTKINSC